MPVIQVKDTQHILKPGQTRLGAGPGVDVSVSEEAALGVQAILEMTDESQVVIRRGRDGANVRVNGVVLGVEPTPLMHGDKVDVNGIEVLFSEDKKIGATHFVSASEVAAIAAKRWVEHVVIGQPFGVLGLDSAGMASWLQLETPAGLPALAELAQVGGLLGG